MKLILKHALFFCLALVLFSSNTEAEGKKLDSGLIIENYKKIRISIEDISDDGKKIYLSQDTVRSQVESQFQKKGLTPANDETIKGVLSIQLIVFKNVCNIGIAFNRLVTYSSGSKTYVTMGKVWNNGALLLHSGDPSYILKSLESKLDTFITEYIRDNEKAFPSSK